MLPLQEWSDEQLASEHRISHNLPVEYLPGLTAPCNLLWDPFHRPLWLCLLKSCSHRKTGSSFFSVTSSALNDSSLDWLGKRADGISHSLLVVINGVPTNSPVSRIIASDPKICEAKNLNRARVEQVIAIRNLQSDLKIIHKNAESAVTSRRYRSIVAYKKSTNIIFPSFEIVGFVLVHRSNDRGYKPRFKWYDHCHITGVHSTLVYGFTYLQGGKSDL